MASSTRNQDWQSSKATIAERAKHMLIYGLYADCQFLVGPNGCEMLIKAHKNFLAISSPVFATMLFNKVTAEGAVSNEPITLEDMTPPVFRNLLMYIHTGSIETHNLQSLEEAVGLSEAAKKYIPDWQSSKFRIPERTKHLLETGLYSDCKFLVGAAGSKQQVFKAHKNVLAMSSSVFAEMLFGPAKMFFGPAEMFFGPKVAESAESVKSNEPIAVPDLTPSSFHHLLQHIYSSDTSILQRSLFDSLPDPIAAAKGLYHAAKKYNMPNIVAECERYIRGKIYATNTLRELESSKLCDDENLKATIQTECWSVLRQATTQSVSSSYLELIPKSTLLSIVKDGTLDIREVELFKAVKRWAEHQCTLNGLEINGTNMREILGEIMNEIRFLAMTHEEFASYPARSGILTKEEYCDISMNLVEPIDGINSPWPLPPQFSDRRRQREGFYLSLALMASSEKRKREEEDSYSSRP